MTPSRISRAPSAADSSCRFVRSVSDVRVMAVRRALGGSAQRQVDVAAPSRSTVNRSARSSGTSLIASRTASRVTTECSLICKITSPVSSPAFCARAIAEDDRHGRRRRGGLRRIPVSRGPSASRRRNLNSAATRSPVTSRGIETKPHGQRPPALGAQDRELDVLVHRGPRDESLQQARLRDRPSLEGDHDVPGAHARPGRRRVLHHVHDHHAEPLADAVALGTARSISCSLRSRIRTPEPRPASRVRRRRRALRTTSARRRERADDGAHGRPPLSSFTSASTAAARRG